ncbi:MAG: hypothetical protein ABI614_27640 [Planctomycetota bacterium]
MLGHLMGGVKDDYRASAGGDDDAVGEADPLALVLTEELVADSPVRRLVLTPVGMDLASNCGGSPSAKLFIGHLGCIAWVVVILQPLGLSVERYDHWQTSCQCQDGRVTISTPFIEV